MKEKTGKSLSVIVPALNEEQTIEVMVTTILAVAADYLNDIEIFLVDDGSTDRTGLIMDQLARIHPETVVIHHDQPKGVGYSFLECLDRARFPQITVIPGDNAYREDGIRKLFSQVGTTDLVIGYRDNLHSRSLYRSLQSRLMRAILNLLFGYGLSDFHAMVLYPVAATRALGLTSTGFSYQMEAIVSLLQDGATFGQVPVSLNSEKQGMSRAMRPKTYLDLAGALLRLLVRGFSRTQLRVIPKV